MKMLKTMILTLFPVFALGDSTGTIQVLKNIREGLRNRVLTASLVETVDGDSAEFRDFIFNFTDHSHIRCNPDVRESPLPSVPYSDMTFYEIDGHGNHSCTKTPPVSTRSVVILRCDTIRMDTSILFLDLFSLKIMDSLSDSTDFSNTFVFANNGDSLPVAINHSGVQARVVFGLSAEGRRYVSRIQTNGFSWEIKGNASIH